MHTHACMHTHAHTGMLETAEVSDFRRRIQLQEWEEVENYMSQCHAKADEGPAQAREQMCKDGWIAALGPIIAGNNFPQNSDEHAVDYVKQRMRLCGLRLQTYVHIPVCMYICECVCVCIYIYVYIYI